MKAVVIISCRMSGMQTDLCDCFFLLRPLESESNTIYAVDLFTNLELPVDRDGCVTITLLNLIRYISAHPRRCVPHSSCTEHSVGIRYAKLLYNLLSEFSEALPTFSSAAFYTSRVPSFRDVTAFRDPDSGYRYLCTLADIKSGIDACSRGISLQLLSVAGPHCQSLRDLFADEEVASFVNVFIVEVRVPLSALQPLFSGAMLSQDRDIPQLYLTIPYPSIAEPVPSQSASTYDYQALYAVSSPKLTLQPKPSRRSNGAYERLLLRGQSTTPASTQEGQTDCRACYTPAQAQHPQTPGLFPYIPPSTPAQVGTAGSIGVYYPPEAYPNAEPGQQAASGSLGQATANMEHQYSDHYSAHRLSSDANHRSSLNTSHCASPDSYSPSFGTSTSNYLSSHASTGFNPFLDAANSSNSTDSLDTASSAANYRPPADTSANYYSPADTNTNYTPVNYPSSDTNTSHYLPLYTNTNYHPSSYTHAYPLYTNADHYLPSHTSASYYQPFHTSANSCLSSSASHRYGAVEVPTSWHSGHSDTFEALESYSNQVPPLNYVNGQVTDAGQHGVEDQQDAEEEDQLDMDEDQLDADEDQLDADEDQLDADEDQLDADEDQLDADEDQQNVKDQHIHSYPYQY
ncbi:hypothetical protein VKT23_007594 [Stygiomarasmius scandens]|uniref:Uncharacterized protein n=1 Tax=Marasmiellus scandens TaxID=2682957 RepID=A0ABR1JKX7_9AGAR